MPADPPADDTVPASPARRDWIRLAAVGTGVTALGTAAWQWRQARQSPLSLADHERAMLSRIVDLLVPRDDTPGALDLGLDRSLFDHLQASAARTLAHAELLRELDRDAGAHHGANFLALDEAQQTASLQRLSQVLPWQAGAQGWLQLRQQTMALYYAQPAAWPSLGLSGPPQPAGHPDYTDAPRHR